MNDGPYERVKNISISLSLLKRSRSGIWSRAAGVVGSVCLLSSVMGQAGLPVSLGGYDFDGDGVSDALVSRLQESEGSVGVGCIDVISGATQEIILTVCSETPGEMFGLSVSTAGDVDGDGVHDIVVGAPLWSVEDENSGRVYVHSGADGELLIAFDGQPGSFFGSAVSAAGDINGDGRLDIAAAGRSQWIDGDSVAHESFVAVFDVETGDEIRRFVSHDPVSVLGSAITTLGDLDRDGCDEIAIGDSNAPGSGSALGAIYIFDGGGHEEIPSVVDTSMASAVIQNGNSALGYGFSLMPLFDQALDEIAGVISISVSTAADTEPFVATFVGIDGIVLEEHPFTELIPLGDTDGTQSVDIDDVSHVVSDIGTESVTPLPIGSDINGDGIVEAGDLSIAVGNLGSEGVLEDLAPFGASYAAISGNLNPMCCIEWGEGVAFGCRRWDICQRIDPVPGVGDAGDPTNNGASGSGDSDGSHGGGGGPGDQDDGGVVVGGGDGCGVTLYSTSGTSVFYSCDEDDQASIFDLVAQGYTNGVGLGYSWSLPVGLEHVGPGPASGPLIQVRITQPGMHIATVVYHTAGGRTCSAEVAIEATEVCIDLDIDSDNTNGYEMPDRSDGEDEVEDGVEDEVGELSLPGKIVYLNTDDIDDDGVPDFADGFDRFSNSGPGASERFIPMIVDVSGIDHSDATIQFMYSSSNPGDLVLEANEFGDNYYLAALGRLRLWTKDGNQSRLSAGVESGGDYIAPDIEFPLSELGNADLFTVFVEAISASESPADISILVNVLIDGAIVASDTVCLTAIPQVVIAYSQIDTVRVAGLELVPLYTNGDAEIGDFATGVFYAGVVSENFTSLQVGTDRPNLYAQNNAAKDLERFELGIQFSSEVIKPFGRGVALLTGDAEYGTGSAAVLSGDAWFPPLFDPSAPSPPPEESEEEYEDWIDPNPGELDPDGFEARFEEFLEDRYGSASPSIEELEREAFELRGIRYGGRNFEWFSARHVWRDGNSIFVEDSLDPEEAADDYYEYLNEHYGGDPPSISFTPILRNYATLNELSSEVINPGNPQFDRTEMGEFMARHVGLFDATASDFAGEVYTVGVGFAFGAVLDLRRAGKIRQVSGTTNSWPLYQRNFMRGNWVEHDTIVNSLGRTKNTSIVSGTVDGVGIVNTIPDIVNSHTVGEIKDWIRLSRVRQIRAQAAAAKVAGKRYVLVCTTRTKSISGPLHKLIDEQDGASLLRRDVNLNKYQKFDYSFVDGPGSQRVGWVDISIQDVQRILDGL